MTHAVLPALRARQDSSDAYLSPEDLAHLTRRTLFLVVEADNAHTFARLQVRQRLGAVCVRVCVRGRGVTVPY